MKYLAENAGLRDETLRNDKKSERGLRLDSGESCAASSVLCRAMKCLAEDGRFLRRALERARE